MTPIGPVTPLEIIFEDSELLAVNKPAGLVCHPTKGDEWSSLVGRTRLYLGGAGARLINRLDRETSGVVLAAKTAEAAGALGKLWEKRAVEKEYLAIVHGTVRDDSGVIDFRLGKDEKSEIAIKDCVRADGAVALTEYAVEERFVRDGREFSLLRVHPRTGRKHQIRIHLAAIGHPIVGDKLYGGDESLYMALVKDRLGPEQMGKLLLTNHALHSEKLAFFWEGELRTFLAQPSDEFVRFARNTQ